MNWGRAWCDRVCLSQRRRVLCADSPASAENNITELPVCLHTCTGVTELNPDINNGLLFPPCEVVEQGTRAVRELLRSR